MLHLRFVIDTKSRRTLEEIGEPFSLEGRTLIYAEREVAGVDALISAVRQDGFQRGVQA